MREGERGGNFNVLSLHLSSVVKLFSSEHLAARQCFAANILRS